MSLNRKELTAAVTRHGTVARVVVAEVFGSTPREVGAAMLVWPDGQSGTIGGGTLEFEAAKAARQQITAGPRSLLTAHALGPDMGQCCGGHVSLLTDLFDARRVADLPETVFARPVTDTATGEMPLAVARCLSEARNSGLMPEPQLVQGWMVEPVAATPAPLWIFGAGHVGRALVEVLAPLPGFAITWVDTAPDRFPETIPPGVTPRIAASPAEAVAGAPHDAHHLILTYSHALDLELCDAILHRGFASAGLIGSATKWARFRKRLSALGHGDAQISRIRCPIGQPSLGKHPQAIAIGVAATLISASKPQESAKGATG